MLKKITALALVDHLQALRPSQQTMLRHLKQGVIAAIALGGLYVTVPPLWDAISVSPQQRVEPLKQRINDLDKQIEKSSPTPSTADLKEIATLEKGRIDSENTIRTSLFQAVGGLLVFATLWISYRTLQANEAKQVAERFSKAVEQLGNDNIHVRLGGIYALEQIAKDAEEKYYWQVMETLTSYVRERSPKKRSAAVQKVIDTIKIDIDDKEHTPSLSIDFQAVMTVLARRKHSYGHALEQHPLDLHNADLRKLQLPPKTKLNHANLSEAKLQGANLYKVNLQKTILVGANLQEANLWEALLQEAILEDADLRGARLGHAQLQKARLTSADLRQVVLESADLKGAVLSEAYLHGATLYAADLRGAELILAVLQETILTKAKLQGANLHQATLLHVSFHDTELEGANLDFAKLYAPFGLNLDQLQSTVSHTGVSLPVNLQPELTSSNEMLTAALNAIRTLAASYKSE